MLYEERLDAIASQQINSGGLVPLDAAVALMGHGFYIEEIEFDIDNFHPEYN
jgi:hypothetical protein